MACLTLTFANNGQNALIYPSVFRFIERSFHDRRAIAMTSGQQYQLTHVSCIGLSTTQTVADKVGHERIMEFIHQQLILIYRLWLVHTADTDKTRQLCFVPVGGVNTIGDRTRTVLSCLGKRRSRQISACNDSTVRDSEKVQLLQIGIEVDPAAFQRAIQILAAHAHSGCDTVACCFGIGKNSVLKVVRSGISLSLLGRIDTPLPAVIEQATLFMTVCYGQNVIQCQMLD